jgi:hypothetical protein
MEGKTHIEIISEMKAKGDKNIRGIIILETKGRKQNI